MKNVLLVFLLFIVGYSYAGVTGDAIFWVINDVFTDYNELDASDLYHPRILDEFGNMNSLYDIVNIDSVKYTIEMDLVYYKPIPIILDSTILDFNSRYSHQYIQFDPLNFTLSFISNFGFASGIISFIESWDIAIDGERLTDIQFVFY